MIQNNATHPYRGLSNEEVISSREKYGNNLLTPPKRQSFFKLYLDNFKDPIIKVLLFAVVLSFIIAVFENEYAETIGIVIAIFLATTIGFYFEYDATKKFDLLNLVNEESLVKVMRQGKVIEVARKDIVVGDVILIESGDEIPADGFLLQSVNLQVNESALTGELLIEKSLLANEQSVGNESTYPANKVYRGTTVVDGHGIFEVLAVGDSTELGRVAHLSAEPIEQPTPLAIQLERLASLIGKIGFGIAISVFLIFFVKDVILAFNFSELTSLEDWLPVAQRTLSYFMMAVTLIVVVVPEGLPMSVTLSLALNMRRMLRTQNLVRKMHASETMGAVTVICSDKTGTLTQNKMHVVASSFHQDDLLESAGSRTTLSSLIAQGISVNSTAYIDSEKSEPSVIGNPTEGALLMWLNEMSIDYRLFRDEATIVDQMTFSTERKYMASLIESPLFNGKRILYIKGAPEMILSKCATIYSENGCVDFTSEQRDVAQNHLSNYQAKGMRTLALAYVVVDDLSQIKCEDIVNEASLCYLGVVAIADPIRKDIKTAIHSCSTAGIAVKIVTGDTEKTTLEIARQIGLWNSHDDLSKSTISGTDFAALTDEDARKRTKELKIMYRARPSDKQRLVRLLQEEGEVVAVTGDGTNDAPALNRAQVGLSMGSGTSVAKEASDITLLDDSFNSISVAVMWGRSLYKNIQRFILFQLTINLVALAVVFISSFVADKLLLTVTQMLWVNLIMDTFAALALASVPPNASVMLEAPRKKSDFIISNLMYKHIIVVGVIFSMVVLGLYFYFLKRDVEITDYHLTIIFTTFVMLQFWNLFNAYVFGSTQSALNGLTHSYGMLLVLLLILIGQIVIVQYGGELFRTVPLDFPVWSLIFLGTSLVLWIGESIRFLKRRLCNQ